GRADSSSKPERRRAGPDVKDRRRNGRGNRGGKRDRTHGTRDRNAGGPADVRRKRTENPKLPRNRSTVPDTPAGRTSGKLSEKRRNSVRGIRKRILFERRDRPPERSLFPVPSGSGTDGGKRRRKPSVYRRRRKSTWQSAV